MTSKAKTSTYFNFGGEAGQCINSIDWAATPVGNIDTWPQSLRTAVGMVLDAPTPMCIAWGNDFTQVYNDSFAALLGVAYHPQAMGASSCETFASVWANLEPLLAEAMEGRASTSEFALPPDSNGLVGKHCIALSCSPIRGESGKPDGVLIAITELSKPPSQKLADDHLYMFMQAPVAIAILRGTDFVIDLANDKMLQYWGKQRATTVGRPLFDVLPETRGVGYEELLTSALATGKPYSAQENEVRLVRNGVMTTTYVNFTFQPLLEPGGRHALIIIAHEVTDLVQARNIAQTSASELEKKIEERTHDLVQKNEELRQQRDFVETIINTSIDVIAVYDRDMRFIAVNSKCEEAFKIKKEEILGKSLLDIFPQSLHTKAVSDLQLALDGKYIHNKTYKSTIADLYYENFIIPLRDNSNNVYGVLVIAHDITSSVEFAQRLRQANMQLEKSNKELEQFAYIASHDLQEPLRKIQTFAELLSHSLADRAVATKYLEKINSSAAYMSTLIKEVLNYSRLSLDTQQPVNADLNQIVEKAIAELELHINEKGAIVRYAKLPVVKGIPKHLLQLFLNLIGNSLKFSDNPPVIDIMVRELSAEERDKQLSLDPTMRYAEIAIIDNGIGFEQQYAERIFTIFQRLNNRGIYTGTGIGLALCKKIAENHRGSITAYSERHKGATFLVCLPLV